MNEGPQPAMAVVNVSLHGDKKTVLAGLFPLAYAAVLTCLLLQAFRMMRPTSASKASASNDRTGLKTTHPELLDENGEVIFAILVITAFANVANANGCPQGKSIEATSVEAYYKADEKAEVEA